MGARLGAKYNRQNITDNAIRNTFLAKAQIHIQSYVDLQTLEKLDKL